MTASNFKTNFTAELRRSANMTAVASTMISNDHVNMTNNDREMTVSSGDVTTINAGKLTAVITQTTNVDAMRADSEATATINKDETTVKGKMTDEAMMTDDRLQGAEVIRKAHLHCRKHAALIRHGWAQQWWTNLLLWLFTSKITTMMAANSA